MFHHIAAHIPLLFRCFSLILCLSSAELSKLPRDATFNIPEHIIEKLDRQLYKQKQHPLEIIKSKIFQHFQRRYADEGKQSVFKTFEDLSPVVTVKANFDDLLFPEDHVSRFHSLCCANA